MNGGGMFERLWQIHEKLTQVSWFTLCSYTPPIYFLIASLPLGEKTCIPFVPSGNLGIHMVYLSH